MLNFQCPKYRASASLCPFPRLHITYETAVPRVQHHDIFRVKLRKAGAGVCRTWHELRGPMPEIAEFFYTMNEGVVKSTTWNFDDHDLELDFTRPVRVGEYENIEHMVMTYYPKWAPTEEMRAAHAEWRARVNSLDD